MRHDRNTSLWIVILAGLLLLPAGCARPHEAGHHRQAQAEAGPHQGEHHHRRPADIQEYLSHLDRPERDEYQQPARVIEALGIEPGMAIADLGSGSGYFTRRFAEALNGTGAVYAIDVEQEMLDYVRASLEGRPGASVVTFVLAKPDDPGLPPASVDLVFVCNVAHHIEDRPAYFARLSAALKPGGRIAIIDFYHDHRSGDVGFPRRHLVPRETILAEMTRAGYRLLTEHDFLTRQYFLEFGRAGS